MKPWVAKASELLWISLDVPKHELNELDWKAALSPDKKRLREHLSAFSNHPGGGFLVYGIDPNGTPIGITQDQIQETLTQLTNLGRHAVEPPIALDHSVETYESIPLLFVFIAEAPVKPVHMRGKGIEGSFIRSGGTTRQASRPEIGNMMLHSKTPRWEELRATLLLTDAELIARLDIEPILKISERPPPSNDGQILNGWLARNSSSESLPAEVTSRIWER